MAGTTGLEPATSAVTGQRSNQLSYVPSVVACDCQLPGHAEARGHSQSQQQDRVYQNFCVEGILRRESSALSQFHASAAHGCSGTARCCGQAIASGEIGEAPVAIVV
jgi:hypothetical protein